jgi:hypothetical protein
MVIPKKNQLKAIGGRKINHILIWINNGDDVLGDKALIKHVTEFYKGLFGQATMSDLRIDGIECKPVIRRGHDGANGAIYMEEIKGV